MAYLDENGLEHFWGKIKDRVSSAVASKANDADVVHKTGDETISGFKTFQNSWNIPDSEETGTEIVLRNPEVSRGVPLEGGCSWTRVIFADKEGDTEATKAGRLGLFEVMSPKEGDTTGSQLLLSCYKYSSDPADYAKRSQFTVGYDPNDIPYATAPATSDDRTVSTDVVTRGFMEASEWNWQKTKKAGAVTFKPVPESDLEPVVDFMFTETLPAEGEKAPDNPSTITGVSAATVTHCETEGVESTNYTIQLGDTYYGGSLDVATGVMTVTWHGTKLTSASNFRGPFDIAHSGSNKRYVADLPYGSASYTATNQACSHYNYSHSFDSNIQQAWVSSSGSCYIYDSFATVEELNAFLDFQNSNGTPVIICYQLASPYTVQLTPTQIRSLPALDKYEPRINTVYTDQEAVHVGYQRFTGGAVKAFGTTAARTLPERFADIVNVKDFGAKGDGSTDDAAAIQACIDANEGRCIFFPEGVYVVSEPITTKRNREKGTTLSFSYNATLKASSSFELGEFLVKIGVGSSVASKAKTGGIFGGVFDTNNRASGVFYGGPKGCAFENLRIINCQYTGMKVYDNTGVNDNVSDAWIENLQVYFTSNETVGSTSTQIGLIIAGSDNNVVGFRSYGGECGIKFIKGGNFITDAHPTTHSANLTNYENTIAYNQEAGTANTFSKCYSDNFCIGWLVDNQMSAFVNCTAYWYSDTDAKHICIKCLSQNSFFGKIFGFRALTPQNGDNYILFMPYSTVNTAFFASGNTQGLITGLSVPNANARYLKHPLSELAFISAFSRHCEQISNDAASMTNGKWYPVASFLKTTSFSTSHFEVEISNSSIILKLILKTNGVDEFSVEKAHFLSNPKNASMSLGIGSLTDCFVDNGGSAKTSFMLYIKCSSDDEAPTTNFVTTLKHNGRVAMYKWNRNLLNLGQVAGYYNVDSIPNQIGSTVAIVDGTW